MCSQVGGGALRSRRPSAADVPAVPTAAVDVADAADVRGADVHEDDDTDPVPAYLLELLQNHRNRQHLEEDLYHDDYRERYDGFDQPPPFRQRHVRHAAKPRAVRAVDLEISEEEAFSTRVFVTTPRRQR
ncbi:hypothetical protein ONE63_005415 [Megalurothrips usitatus]|uniref:Uncharacterized protein n=1 Tax=Megalurothrips usitatus TaxID=439358 RepID=A0AAV7Y296_9NEOP|nr:hypothetical protein ONE63_005415 [Megalurothrips usitatus]